jgi:hypothetical protein
LVSHGKSSSIVLRTHAVKKLGMRRRVEEPVEVSRLIQDINIGVPESTLMWLESSWNGQ